jgi:hypothetical protein
MFSRVKQAKFDCGIAKCLEGVRCGRASSFIEPVRH